MFFAENYKLMKLLFHPSSLDHDTGMHPENKKRLEALGEMESADIPFDESVLKLIHTEDYIEQVKVFSQAGKPLDNDTQTSVKSYEAAVYAANTTIAASKTNDFAIVRPPGHHAYRERASGFCIFNNVAIAAQRLANEGKKVLIFDFDGHLGDGTSEIFYASDQIMYWSIHQFPAFPGHGSEHEIGRGKGDGFTINVPLPPHFGDDIFMDGFNSTLAIAKQFEPDVVAVSAGFDAHVYDLLLDLRLTVDTYYTIGKVLRKHFDRIFATLEGGYNIEELPKCLHNFVNGINGHRKRFSERPTESDIKIWGDYEIRINNLLVNLQKHWNI